MTEQRPELPPAERDDLMSKLTAEISGFADYQANTSRGIPIFELLPALKESGSP